MAKNNHIKLRIAALNDYFQGTDNIVDVVIRAIEDYDLLLFERVRSETLKKQVLSGIEDLWDTAAVLAKEDTTPIRHTIQITLDSIEHANMCLRLGCNWFGWITFHIDLIRYHLRKIPLLDVLSLHIAEHGNNPAEKEELLQQISQRIVTAYSISSMVEADNVRKDAPKQCPEACESIEDAPYLEKLYCFLKQHHHTDHDLQEAWKLMLEKKSRKVDSSKWHGLLPPEDALLVLFENLNYDEVKRHERVFAMM